MSIYYSPELVKALMRERILEAQERRSLADEESDDRVVQSESLLERLLLRRPSEPATCTSC